MIKKIWAKYIIIQASALVVLLDGKSDVSQEQFQAPPSQLRQLHLECCKMKAQLTVELHFQNAFL